MSAASRACALLFAATLSLAAPGCSRERSRAVDEPNTPRQEQTRDYRGVLERVRSRQGPVQTQQELEAAIRKFHHDLARLPTNLMELVHRRYLPELKKLPDDHTYSYDPVHGNVAVVPLDIRGMPRLPDHVTDQTRANMQAAPLPPPPP